MRESIKLEDLRKEVGEDMIHQLKSSQTRIKLLEKTWAKDQILLKSLQIHIRDVCKKCYKYRPNHKSCGNCDQREYCVDYMNNPNGK